jgi:glycosyltransferase involved in cell wall biosynthesis
LKCNFKVIYDAHEYEAYTHNISFFKSFVIKLIEKLLIPKVNVMITVSGSIAAAYKRSFPGTNPITIHNTPRLTPITESNIFRKKLGIPEQKKIFLYQGLIGSGRGIELILDALKYLDKDLACAVFMGYGPLVPLVKEATRKYENVYYQDFVHPDKLLAYTASADFGLNLTVNTCLSRYYALPNKLFEYCAASVPPIVSNHIERGNFVSEKRIGFVVKDNDLEDLVSKFNEACMLPSNFFKKNLSQVSSEYNWEVESKKLTQAYQDLFKPNL